jgi:hypothetical protein
VNNVVKLGTNGSIYAQKDMNEPSPERFDTEMTRKSLSSPRSIQTFSKCTFVRMAVQHARGQTQETNVQAIDTFHAAFQSSLRSYHA